MLLTVSSCAISDNVSVIDGMSTPGSRLQNN